MSDEIRDQKRRRDVSRRDFIKLAAAAGLLAGCSPTGQPTTPPTGAAPAGDGTTPAPPAASDPVPTTAPDPTPTLEPAGAPAWRELIKVYPDGPSRLVHTHHAGVWDGEALQPAAIREMLDASITQLTGLNDAGQAWAAMFDPGARIAIKVNTIQGSGFWTHVPLVLGVTECLQDAGVPPEQIVVFDRLTYELEADGFPINLDGPGVRCYGTNTGSSYATGWTLEGRDIGLSNVLLECDALINMPIIKQHSMSGISFAMKNHYGTFDQPHWFHGNLGYSIAELNALAPIRNRTRLIIGDALEVSTHSWYIGVPGDSILMSLDPVAHDTLGLQIHAEALAAAGGNPDRATGVASLWLANGVAMGLGTNEPDNMDLVEVTLA